MLQLTEVDRMQTTDRAAVYISERERLLSEIVTELAKGPTVVLRGVLDAIHDLAAKREQPNLRIVMPTARRSKGGAA